MATEDGTEMAMALTESDCADVKELAQELDDTEKERKGAIESYKRMIAAYRRLNEIDEQEGKPPQYQEKLEEALKFLALLEKVEDDIKRIEPILNQVPGSTFKTRTIGGRGYEYSIKTTLDGERPAWRVIRKWIDAEDDGSGLVQATQSYEFPTNPARIPFKPDGQVIESPERKDPPRYVFDYSDHYKNPFARQPEPEVD